jgi:hypothetical protein
MIFDLGLETKLLIHCISKFLSKLNKCFFINPVILSEFGRILKVIMRMYHNFQEIAVQFSYHLPEDNLLFLSKDNTNSNQ